MTKYQVSSKPVLELPLGRNGLAALMAERQRRAQSIATERARNHSEEVREKCSTLIGFVEEAWPILEPSKKFVSGWLLDAMCDLLERVTRGQIQYLLMNVPPGPMRHDSIVETSLGPKALRDISVGEMVLTHKGRYRRVTDVHDQGVLPILKITTHSGRETFAAPSHPYLTPKGWVNAENLNCGDVLAVVNRNEERPKSAIMTPEEARLLGYIVGDGSVTHSPSFVNNDRDIIEDFRRCAEVCGFKTSERQRKTFWIVGIQGAKDFLKQHGLLGKNSYTKRIPERVMGANREAIANFIGAYWSCDGGIDVRSSRARGSCYRAYGTTVSESLAHDLVQALSMCGIESRLRRKARKLETRSQPGGIYRSFSIEIPNEAMTRRLVDLPGVCPIKRARGAQCGVDYDRPLWNDPIVSIEAQPDAHCLCLTVEEDHSFTCSGIAVKNCMKSLLLVFWTTWEWGPFGRPDLSFLATSYSKDNLDRDADKIRKLISSDWYKSLWPEVALRRERNAIDLFELSRGGWHDSRPFASMTGGRADRTKLDDPHSVEGAESDAQRASTIRKFREGISDRLNDLRSSVMVIIMQRVHEGDVSGLVLELDIGFVHFCLPMEYDPKRHCEIVIDGEVIFSDPRKEAGELLFPERFPKAELERLRRIKGEYAWSAQYDQLPSPRSGGMFKPDMIEVVDAIPHGVVDWCRAWDLAASVNGDWTAGPLLGKIRDGRFIIADMRRERFTSDMRDALIRNTAASDGKEVKISIPEEPAAAGKTLAINHARMLAGYRVEVSRENGAKEVRADPFSSQVNVGNVLMLRGDWNRALIDEMRVFPNGKYDDQIDALSRAFKKLVFGVQKALIAAPIVVSGVRPSPG